MATILVDTGVWIALCDARDTTVSKADLADISQRLRPHSIILPWPVAYQTLRTRFVHNATALRRFEGELRSPQIAFFDDAPYRDEAYRLVISMSRSGRPMSLVDCLLRLIISDRNTRIRYFVSFNKRDFSDVCRTHKIELWSGPPV